MNIFKKLFSTSDKKTEIKQNYTPYNSISVTDMPMHTIWSAHNYNSFCTEAYHKNPIVYSCVRMTADGAARIPLRLYKNNNILENHPALSLLHMPNTQQNAFALRSELLSGLQISGNAYLKIVTDKQNGKKPLALYALRPDRISIETTSQGHIRHYNYGALSSDKKEKIAPDKMLHLKYYSATDDYYGQAPLFAAMRANDIHNKISDFQKSLLDNSARPSGCLVYHGTHNAPNLTKDQFERLKSELENNYMGASAAGRPMILEGGLDWKTMSLTPADMEFAELRHQTAREIALCFGIPPMMLGIPGDNTYSNYQEAIRVFTRNTLIQCQKNYVMHYHKNFLSFTEKNSFLNQIQMHFLPFYLRESHKNFIANANFLTNEQKYKLLFS